MNPKPVTVIATFQANPGKEVELQKALTSLIARTRQEPGCINYDLHVSAEYPSRFLFHETWTSRAHLDAHLQSEHVKVMFPRVSELCVAFPDIVVWDKIA
jgi:quinol monooxygenase YgiN